jgi:hypothetical protein
MLLKWDEDSYFTLEKWTNGFMMVLWLPIKI